MPGVAALLRGLNPEQRRAVTHGEGPLLVVAGPGTGKTHVITRRIAWLLATKRARPSEILALTFTDRAADEMQARVDVLVPYGYVDTAIHTFHAFADRLVREFAFELGLPRDPRVLSQGEAIAFLSQHLFQLGLKEYRPLGDPTRFVSSLVSLFNRAKDEDVSPEMYRRFADALAERATSDTANDADGEAVARVKEAARHTELAVAYEHYQMLLAGAGLIDFGDQLALALRLLRQHPDVRRTVQQRFRYILVDEFQDTNPAQLTLLRLLCAPPHNVTAVGDDDQAIYMFRGAATGAMLEFNERFGNAARIVLRRNYRSRIPILEAAQQLIRHNGHARAEARLGLENRLQAQRRAKGVPVAAHAFGTRDEEAEWVATAIAERLERSARRSDFAILARTNAELDAFARSLNLRGIPWRGGVASALYGQPEVRRLLSFMRVIVSPSSTVDLYALATAEPYNLGGGDLTALLEFTRRRHRSLWSVIEELETQPGLVRVSPATTRALDCLRRDIRAAIDLSHRRSGGEVLYDHLKRSGTLRALVAANTPAAEDGLADLARFFVVVRGQSNILADDRLAFLAERVDALIDAGDEPPASALTDEGDAVAVLTVHKAKGLEFSVVFVVGLADGGFPSRERRAPLRLPDELTGRSPIEDVPFAEERRLCYVALTRARDELVLTYAADTGGRRIRRPSPFLAEALDAPPPTAAPPQRLDVQAPTSGVAARTTATNTAGSSSLTLSYSQLDDYLTCPLKYRMRHVLGVPVPGHHALAYGTALHQAVAAFHQAQLKGRPMSADDLIAVYRAHWSADGFLSREHEEARFAAGRDALLRFHESQRSASPPAAVEHEFTFRLGEDRIRGRIDRVDETPEGVVITDYKSSDIREGPKANQKTRESLQLAIYALAHESSTGMPPAAVQLHFLESGVVGRSTVNRARLDSAREKIETAAQGIRARAFEPRPNYVACSYCPFRDVCPSSAA